MSVWIDQYGIGGAEQWATEIATSIRDCNTFILLLSDRSAASENVLKELSLAAEKRKRILPIELGGHTDLPTAFKHPLAGRERLAYGDFDAVLAAIHGNTAPQAPVKDSRKTLMILPFKDRSPDVENEWFADGLMSEMIEMLSQIKSLRLIDQKTSREYKDREINQREIADKLGVQYFIQGSVCKFEEQIDIDTQLLDVESGDDLWSHSYNGKFKDIFDVQEQVATSVVDGLKLTLSSEEKTNLRERGTDNSDAWALYLKADDYYRQHSKSSAEHAIWQISEALRMDPTFAEAMDRKAQFILGSYRSYDRDPRHLAACEELLNTALQLRPTLWRAYSRIAMLYQLQGKLPEAEAVSQLYAIHAPQDPNSHFHLAGFYANAGRYNEAIPSYIKAIELGPGFLAAYWCLIVCLNSIQDKAGAASWSNKAIPLYERHLEFSPDQMEYRISYIALKFYAGKPEESLRSLTELDKSRLDPESIYKIACLYALLGDLVQALDFVTKAVDAGYANFELLQMDPDMDPLRPLPEFVQLLKQMQKA